VCCAAKCLALPCLLPVAVLQQKWPKVVLNVTPGLHGEIQFAMIRRKPRCHKRSNLVAHHGCRSSTWKGDFSMQKKLFCIKI
jgi:hypothetical protein